MYPFGDQDPKEGLVHGGFINPAFMQNHGPPQFPIMGFGINTNMGMPTNFNDFPLQQHFPAAGVNPLNQPRPSSFFSGFGCMSPFSFPCEAELTLRSQPNV